MTMLIADRKAIEHAGCHGCTRKDGVFEVFWAEKGTWPEGEKSTPNEEGWYVGVPDCESDTVHGPYTTSEEAKLVHELSFAEV